MNSETYTISTPYNEVILRSVLFTKYLYYLQIIVGSVSHLNFIAYFHSAALIIDHNIYTMKPVWQKELILGYLILMISPLPLLEMVLNVNNCCFFNLVTMECINLSCLNLMLLLADIFSHIVFDSRLQVKSSVCWIKQERWR